MKLLLIEDNKQLVEDISKYLEERDFLVEIAYTISQAKDKIKLYEYDLAILDLGLPDGDGLQLVDEIRQHQAGMAILILTAKHSLEYKISTESYCSFVNN